MNKSQINIAELVAKQLDELKVQDNTDFQSLIDAQFNKIDEEQSSIIKDHRRTTMKGPRKTYINKMAKSGYPPITVYIKQEYIDIINSLMVGNRNSKIKKTRSEVMNELLEKILNNEI